MKKIIEQIKKLELCDDEDFFKLLTTSTTFVKKEELDLSGIYVNEERVSLITPVVNDKYTMSIAIHEAGHLYDYYCNGKIIDSEETALSWEFKYLVFNKMYSLLQERVKLVNENKKYIKKRN